MTVQKEMELIASSGSVRSITIELPDYEKYLARVVLHGEPAVRDLQISLSKALAEKLMDVAFGRLQGAHEQAHRWHGEEPVSVVAYHAQAYISLTFSTSSDEPNRIATLSRLEFANAMHKVIAALDEGEEIRKSAAIREMEHRLAYLRRVPDPYYPPNPNPPGAPAFLQNRPGQ